MKIKCIETGYLRENCYIVENNSSCIVIDPGDDFLKIEKNIEKPVVAVFVTHRHFDHIGALDKVLSKYKCALYDRETSMEKEYQIDGFQFKIIFNPGHSKDSISFYFYKEKIMFVGDFIFKNNIGRCDLEGGSFSEMMKSIKKIKEYDDDIAIYPGHGPSTTLIEEKEENIYFNM